MHVKEHNSALALHKSYSMLKMHKTAFESAQKCIKVRECACSVCVHVQVHVCAASEPASVKEINKPIGDK